MHIRFEITQVLTCVFCEIGEICFWMKMSFGFCSTKATYIFVVENILLGGNNILSKYL